MDDKNRSKALELAIAGVEKEFGKSLMPSFKDRLSPSDIDDLVAFLSGLGGAK